MAAEPDRVAPNIGNISQKSGKPATYDRATQDMGNIVALDHVNLNVPDQQIATLFYLMGMGFTRDPYIVVGLDNMWVNVGRSQFHLPTRSNAHRLRGTIGIIVSDLRALQQRLEKIAPRLTGTQFRFESGDHCVDVVCPWGNRFRCHAPAQALGAMELGVPYIEFTVPHGTVDGIARFYREGFGAMVSVEQRAAGAVACVDAGRTQKLLFAETDGELPPFEGDHIQIYVTDFSGPHRFLLDRGLITEECSDYQYRFSEIVDPSSGRSLFTAEHEVRSLTHPLYGRPLVNRNPAQTNISYVRGHDAFRGSY